MVLFFVINILFYGCSQSQKLSEKVLINLSLQAGKPAEIQIYNRLIENFENAHPCIKVKTEFVARDYFPKLQTQIAGGNAPDVMFTNNYLFPAFASKGVYLNLDPYIKEDEEFSLSDFYPVMVDAFKWKEKLYAIPTDNSSTALFYNVDMFDKGGIKNPDDTWGWDTFLDACKKLTKDIESDGRIGKFGYILNISEFEWSYWIWQNGGGIINDSNAECVMNSPQTIEALQFFMDLVNKHRVAPKSAERSDMGYFETFMTGRAAMISVTYGIVPLYAQIRDFKWDVAPLPKGKCRASVMGSGAYAISSHTRHPQETWELVKYMMGEEGQNSATTLRQIVPSRKKVAESNIFLNPTEPPLNKQVFIDSLSYSKCFPVTPQYAEMARIMNEELENAFYGKKEVKDSSKELKIKVDNLLQVGILN